VSNPTRFQWLFLPGIPEADSSSNVAESADEVILIGCRNGDQTSPDTTNVHYYSIKYLPIYLSMYLSIFVALQSFVGPWLIFGF
jgi:hypothetical protein